MNKDNEINFKGLLVWIICAVFFMYEFLLRTVVGTFQIQISNDLQLTSLTFSLLSTTAYLVIYGIMQIPVGLIASRLGLKKTLVIALIFCSSSTMLFALSNHFFISIFSRICMGFGSSFGFICLLIAVYDWMPKKNIALFIGISQFIGTLGPMLAAGPLDSLAQNSIIGWRGVFFIMSFIGIFITALVLLFVENNRKNQSKYTILAKPIKVSISLIKIILNKQIWFIALFSGFIYFAIEYFSENIGVAFLKAKGFPPLFSSYMITLAWLGYALGCPLIGFISDKIQRRKNVMLSTALIGLASLLGIIYFPFGKLITSICFILLGFSASGQSIGFATIAEQCKVSHLTIGLGFNNTMIAVVSATGAPIIGSLIYLPTLRNYQQSLSLLIMISVMAIVIAAIAIKETFAKSIAENTFLSTTRRLSF